jgi:hypothetical protein
MEQVVVEPLDFGIDTVRLVDRDGSQIASASQDDSEVPQRCPDGFMLSHATEWAVAVGDMSG